MADKDFKEGEKVEWNWGSGHPSGTVKKVVPDDLTIQSKGKPITKKGDEENPAVELRTDKGVPVAKRASELHHKE